jgi:hypothetical protein
VFKEYLALDAAFSVVSDKEEGSRGGDVIFAEGENFQIHVV